MNAAVVLEALRYVGIFYLLLVAACACAGWHRPLLAYPLRICYSAASITVQTLTAGKVTFVPLGKRVKRRGARGLRNWRFEMQERKEARLERQGKLQRESNAGWATGTEPAPVVSAPPSSFNNYREPEELDERDQAQAVEAQYEYVPPPLAEPTAPPVVEERPSSSSGAHAERAAAPAAKPSLFADDDDDDVPPPPFMAGYDEE